MLKALLLMCLLMTAEVLNTINHAMASKSLGDA